MHIRSVRHRGLKRLLEDDDGREVRQDLVKRVRRVLTALRAAQSVTTLQDLPGWRVHRLVGDRAEIWSISVSGNWRLTFRIEEDAVIDLNLEDYH